MANEYVTSAELKATLSLTGETFADADVAVAVEAASRAVDQLCGRHFYKSVSETRYYTPLSASLVVIDDLADFTTLDTDHDGDGTFEEAWTENTDFVFEPLNAEADGWPRTRIKLHPSSTVGFPVGYPRSVKLVGLFGWDAVPPAVAQATSIVAAQLLKRSREAPFGVVALGIDSAARIARFDPQVAMLLDPLRRLTV